MVVHRFIALLLFLSYFTLGQAKNASAKDKKSPSVRTELAVTPIIYSQESAPEAAGEVLGIVLGIGDTPTLDASRPTSPEVILHD